MLTVRGKTLAEEIVVEKKQVGCILKDTVLSYLCDTNEYIPNTVITFVEILNNAGILAACNESKTSTMSEMFNVFKNFLNKKTSCDSACSGIMDVIVNNVPSHSVIDRLRLEILPSMIPDIISMLDLSNIYEQLIVYEYIYMSECITLHKKLDIIVENNYDMLLTFLEDCSLEISTTSADVELDDELIENSLLTSVDLSKREMLKLRHKYYGEGLELKLNLFNKFIVLHERWLTYNVDDLNEIDDKSITIADLVDSDDLLDMKPIDILKYINGSNDSSQRFSIEEYCHLNKHYQQTPEKVNIILKVLLPLLNVSTINRVRSNEENIKAYKSLDLFVRMMETDNKLVSLIPKNAQEKIVTMWLKMSSPEYKCFRYCREYPYQHYDTQIDKEHENNHCRLIRKITLSDTIKNILLNTCITFDEFGYILSTDNLEMFEIMCKHMEFKSIHQTFYKYLPPKILGCVIDRSLRVNDTPRIKGSPKFTISMYDTVERSKEQINYSLNMLHKFFVDEPSIELVPITDRYEFVECLYIVMYWDYLTMLINNPAYIMNIVTVLASVKNIKEKLSTYYLDVVILKTVLDNALNNVNINTDYHTANHNFIETKLNKLITHMFSDTDMMMSGPDFAEITEELSQYGVKNTEYLSKLKTMQDKIQNKTLTKKTSMFKQSKPNQKYHNYDISDEDSNNNSSDEEY